MRCDRMRVAILVFLFVGSVTSVASAQQAEAPPSAEEIQAMLENARRYTEPGEHHEILERFLGKWDSETSLVMAGNATPPTEGTMEVSWLMEGRYIKFESTGEFLGSEVEMFSIMGYDNFKQSFVVTSINSMDTIMIRSEGDLTPDGDALLVYGTLDEYLTGEHDKMVKTVWRFISDDEIVMEIHDLPIGEENTKVLEFRYTRAEE